MKIDSVIIVKNEEDNIQNLIEQFLEFSYEIHITDTGSTDNTIQIITKYQQKYSNIFLHHFKWVNDFSKARNYSMTCYECKANYQFWCDADDYLNEELINTLKDFSNKENLNDDIYYVKYEYWKNKFMNRQSLLKVKANFKWYDPIHEFIKVYTNNTKNLNFFDNGSKLIHHPSFNFSHCKRNLDIFLEMEKNNYKFTKRNLYYFGRELCNNRLYDKAKEIFKQCIDKDDEVNNLHDINSCINLFNLKDNQAIEYYNKLKDKGIYNQNLIDKHELFRNL